MPNWEYRCIILSCRSIVITVTDLQEIAIYQAAMTLLPAGLPLTSGAVGQAISEVIKLPLLVPDDDYSALIEKVIRNRIAEVLVSR